MNYESIIKENRFPAKGNQIFGVLSKKSELAQLRNITGWADLFQQRHRRELLTETETKIVVEDGLTVSGKPMRDHLEA